jgi:hypothetical protein
MVELFDQLNMPTKFQSSNIQSLILTVYCHWKTLQSILNYSPYLHHLQIRSSWNSSEKFSSQLSYSSIRTLNLRLDGLQIDILNELFHHSPLLRQFKLKSSAWSLKESYRNLLKSITWIQWIDLYTPQLQILDVDIRFHLDNENEKTIEMINEDLRILNFKLDFDFENEHRCWKMIGIFNRKKQQLIHTRSTVNNKMFIENFINLSF